MNPANTNSGSAIPLGMTNTDPVGVFAPLRALRVFFVVACRTQQSYEYRVNYRKANKIGRSNV